MTKIGRNAPCPCGSGKKYKKCCLNKDEDLRSRARQPTPVLDEDDLDELSNRVVDLIDRGKLDQAEAAAIKLLQRYPEVHDGLERLAAVHEARGDFLQAAKYYQQAAELVAKLDDYDPEMGQFFKDKAAELTNKARR
jgi:tetratricopeptide (TPR) repeat protein